MLCIPDWWNIVLYKGMVHILLLLLWISCLIYQTAQKKRSEITEYVQMFGQISVTKHTIININGDTLKICPPEIFFI